MFVPANNSKYFIKIKREVCSLDHTKSWPILVMAINLCNLNIYLLSA